MELIKGDLQRFSVRFFLFLLFYVIFGENSFTLNGIKGCLFGAFAFTGIIEIGDILCTIVINHRLSRVFNNTTSTLYWITFLSLYYFALFSNFTLKKAFLYIILSIIDAIANLIYWYFRDII